MTDTDPVDAVAQDMARRDGNTVWDFLSKKCQIAYRNDARAAIAAYRDALEASGWQVVPKEPTMEMLAAAEHPKITSSRLAALTHDYSNMLSAAPNPEDDNGKQ